MAGRASTPRRNAADRLRRILAGPSSLRTSRADEFETALLRAWSSEEADVATQARGGLTATQRLTIHAVRTRNAERLAVRESERFLLEVFRVLPQPIVLSTPAGLLWNTAFAHHLSLEHAWQRRLPVARRVPVLQRFVLLMERGKELVIPKLIVPLGTEAWSAKMLQLRDASGMAVYLSHVQGDVVDLPPQARLIGLYKASGLTHKQIAHLCAHSKSHVDHVASRHKAQFRHLRSALCHVAVR